MGVGAGLRTQSSLAGMGPCSVLQGLPEVEPLLSVSFLPGEAPLSCWGEEAFLSVPVGSSRLWLSPILH